MGKYYNGGISVSLSTTNASQETVTVDLDTITEYSPSWEYEVESFEAWDFSTVEIPKGRRFSLSITTGALDLTDLNTVKSALINRTVTVTCPEYPLGILMAVSNVSQPLRSSNFFGDYYSISFSLTALSMEHGAYNEVARNDD